MRRERLSKSLSRKGKTELLKRAEKQRERKRKNSSLKERKKRQQKREKRIKESEAHKSSSHVWQSDELHHQRAF